MLSSTDLDTFTFGKNWRGFLAQFNQAALDEAAINIRAWLGGRSLKGKRVLDVGCGSGIHSLSFWQHQPAELVSFDLDPLCVECTQSLRERSGRPDNWRVTSGSALDSNFLAGLGQFDAVYAWGVLHHSGHLWKALANTCQLVVPGGRLWISIYTKGKNYAKDLGLKQRYKAAGRWGKRAMEGRWILGLMWQRLKARQNPLAWNQPSGRGMNTYHDLVDWLGGLPYEVADPQDVIDYCQSQGYKLERVKFAREGGCSVYLFRRLPPEPNAQVQGVL